MSISKMTISVSLEIVVRLFFVPICTFEPFSVSPCNFLIMDEPTNHLDVYAKKALQVALSEFAGTVVLVSHEEAFYHDWTQRVINIETK